MPQISLSIDEKKLKRIEQLSENCNMSVANWVKLQLEKVLEEELPEDFYRLYGSIDDDTLMIHEAPSPELDQKRESL
jgi:hypothetical protein